MGKRSIFHDVPETVSYRCTFAERVTNPASRYNKPSFLDALDQWKEIAANERCSQALLAYRWISYHSPLMPEHGDTLILGASKIEQIHGSVEGLKDGPLSEESVKTIENIWTLVEKDAPFNNI